MTEFNDPILEQYAVELFDTFPNLPLTLDEVLNLIANISLYPSFLQEFVDKAVVLHLNENPEDAEAIWEVMRELANENNDAYDILDESLVKLISLPNLAIGVKNEILTILSTAANEETYELIQENFNGEILNGLSDALSGVDQAIFIFNAYRQYFDQVIPRFRTDPMLQGLLRAKEAIELSLGNLSL